jgi:hypothetical protein
LNATGRQRRLGGITGKGFMPGRSGNPTGLNGRRKALAALVRESTDNGRLLVRLMCRIVRGGKSKISLTANGKAHESLVRPSISDRIEAIRWLADRGWGKARDIVDIDGETRRPFQIVLMGPHRDPLEEPEAVEQAEPKLPALPAQMPEIGFELNLKDLET